MTCKAQDKIPMEILSLLFCPFFAFSERHGGGRSRGSRFSMDAPVEPGLVAQHALVLVRYISCCYTDPLGPREA